MHTSNKDNLTIEFLLSFRLSAGVAPESQPRFHRVPSATHLCRLGEVFSSLMITRPAGVKKIHACPRKMLHGICRHNSTNRLRNTTSQIALARPNQDSIPIQLLSTCLRLFLPTCVPHSSCCCFLLPSCHHRPSTSAPAESTAQFPITMEVCALPSPRACRRETSSCPS